MLYNVTVTFKFKLESDADAHCDAEYHALRYIEEHLLDDEDLNPLNMELVFVS